MSQTESDLDDQEIAENLMMIELDHECKITSIMTIPCYNECIHPDSVRKMGQVRCIRCRLLVNVIDQTMPQNEAKKMKFDVDYVQDNKHMERLQKIVKESRALLCDDQECDPIIQNNRGSDLFCVDQACGY
jgi:hypothetical protein